MFSQVCVCSGGYPSPRFFPRSLVPGPFPGGKVMPGQDWGTSPLGQDRTGVKIPEIQQTRPHLFQMMKYGHLRQFIQEAPHLIGNCGVNKSVSS